jgi:hypothetical protein
MPLYTVKQGDCISSISFEFGFAPAIIWNHPQNAGLKKKRKDWNVLFPGDLVFVPDKQISDYERPTDAVHRFVCERAPQDVLSIRFLYRKKPSAGERYTLVIDNGSTSYGELNADGACIVPISPGSRKATIILGDPDWGEVYQLLLGHLDPVEETSGVRWRLSNLGYLSGSGDGEDDRSVEDSPELQEAIKAFQLDQQLPVGNGLDNFTRQRLQDLHGS